jgi:hypothetical protein
MALDEQQQMINQLQNELAEERYEQEAQTQERASAPPRRPTSAAQEPTEGPPTVLVFRDQHRIETGNYAIAGNKLYILDSQGRQTVALSELDIPATVKANEDRGVEFRPPKAT